MCVAFSCRLTTSLYRSRCPPQRRFLLANSSYNPALGSMLSFMRMICPVHRSWEAVRVAFGHVEITLDQYLQRSDPRMFFHATLRQWNRLPTSLSATTCPEAFRTGLRALTSALISS